MDALHFKSAAELAALVRTRKVSAAELLELFLNRIEKYNPKLNAVIWMDADKARKIVSRCRAPPCIEGL